MLKFYFVTLILLSFHGSWAYKVHNLRLGQMKLNNFPDFQVKKAIPKFLLPAIIGSSLFFGIPDQSQALSSGGRSGGSSFGSSSRSSYSSPRSSFSRQYSSSPSISIMPMYSPFGYSPFGFSPFGFMPINLNMIILAGIAYAAYTVLSNRIGGSDFGDSQNGSLPYGASIVKLSVSLDADWANSRNVMSQLSRLASKYNAMTERQDLSRLLSEACLVLLRARDDWTGSSYSAEKFTERNVQNCESSFQQLAIKERSKFNEENNNDNVLKASNRFDGSLPTKVVVSVVVAVRGQSAAASLGAVRSVTDLAACLERLASDALTDGGDNIMALELLWSPSSPELVLTDRDLVEDYPELLQL